VTERERYTLFLVEQVKVAKGLAGRQVLKAFLEDGVFEWIDQTYEAIHTEDTGAVIRQIAERLADKA
jgi:hypothetical protein